MDQSTSRNADPRPDVRTEASFRSDQRIVPDAPPPPPPVRDAPRTPVGAPRTPSARPRSPERQRDDDARRPDRPQQHDNAERPEPEPVPRLEVERELSGGYAFRKDLASMKGLLVAGALLGGAACVAFGAHAFSARKKTDTTQMANCARAAQKIHVIVYTRKASDAVPLVRALVDQAFCAQRVYITISTRALADVHPSESQKAEMFGAKYAPAFERIRVAQGPAPTQTRQMLAAADAPAGFNVAAPTYTAILHAGALPLPDWDATAIRVLAETIAAWHAPAILTAPLAEPPLGAADVVAPRYAAFAYWQPDSGAPVPRYVAYPDAAALGRPFVGLTPWFVPDCVFAQTLHLRHLARRLGAAGFWKAPPEEFADRYRVAVTAFESNVLLSTLPLPLFCVDPDGGAPALPRMKKGDAGRTTHAWPASPRWTAFSGLDARGRTITPLAGLGIANLEAGAKAAAWQQAAQKRLMAAQMAQRCGSLREAQRRIEVLRAKAAHEAALAPGPPPTAARSARRARRTPAADAAPQKP